MHRDSQKKHGFMGCKKTCHKTWNNHVHCLHVLVLFYSRGPRDRATTFFERNGLYDRCSFAAFLYTAKNQKLFLDTYLWGLNVHPKLTHRTKEVIKTNNAIQDAESNCFKLGSSETVQLVRPTASFFGWL